MLLLLWVIWARGPTVILARMARPCHIEARQQESVVTNRIAIFLGLFLIAAIVVDGMIYGSGHLVFLGKKLFELIEWIAFWR